MAVDLGYILVQRSPKGSELAISIRNRGDKELLGFSELDVLGECWHGVEKIQNSMNCVLRKLLRLAICVEFIELLPKKFKDILKHLLVFS